MGTMPYKMINEIRFSKWSDSYEIHNTKLVGDQ